MLYSLSSTHGGAESMCTDQSKRETTKKDTIKQKPLFDYDWEKLQKNGKLHSLTKPELQHYLKH